MARRFNVKGTNDFIVWAVVLFALGLWCIKDGWFPSQATLDRHPHEILVKADQTGSVKDVFVKRGELIRAEQPIVRLALTETNAEQLLKAPSQGEVGGMLAEKGALISRGQTVATLIPEDTFYTFNHSLAFLSLLGALICAVIHFLVR
jgi:multidrug resistance efflux pump